MSNRFYISTPIYYVNDVPHLGHAYCTIAADALSRFHRAVGDDTRFLTGTDEHGLKVEQAAAERGMTAIQLADQVVERFRSTWTHLDIANDDFIRTTEPRHKEVVTELWRRMEAAGDIYKGKYEGWYCVKCEAYYPESELAEGGLCPVHKSAATWLSEPTYFFRLSKYAQPLLDHFARHPTFVQPDNYRNEVVAFLKSGVRDLSISRTTFQWGIPVPGDEEHVIYVWIDALTNYMSALGPVEGELHRRFWPGAYHLIGKDILKFHAVYWPAMLLSAGLPLPQQVFSTGWWTVRGEKISKSMPATRVDPNALADDIGVDALRYYLLREVPLGLDGDFAYENLVGRYNAELAHDLGNLVSRALTVAGKFAGSRVPDATPSEPQQADRELAEMVARVVQDAAQHFRAFAPSRALESIWRLVGECNRYVNNTAPWKMARVPGSEALLAGTIRRVLEAILTVARMIGPVMPGTGREMARLVGGTDELAATWPAADLFGLELSAGAAVGESKILFPRIDDDRMAALLDKWIPADARAAEAAKPDAAAEAKPARTKGAGGRGKPDAQGAPAAGKPPKASSKPPVEVPEGMVSFQEFGRMDLRVAQVVEAAPVEGATKLLRLKLDVGEAEPRQVVAGIAESFRPEELIGRKVIFLANLAPATIRGVTSQGMVLAAGGDRVLGLSTVDADVPVGTKVR